MNTTKQICTRCIYNSDVPRISFDAQGVCSYCKIHDNLEKEYPLGSEGQRRLETLCHEIKTAGRGKRYDCVVGVSGGCDSCYLVYQLLELGLRPLAVHFDNTWNSPTATLNIYKVLEKLNVDLHTLVVSNREYDDIYRSFMVSGVRDIESPTDIGLASTLYLAAEKHGIKYIIEGHSFRTEGISPLGWLYMDGKYTQSIHRQFGRVRMKTYPNMTLARFMRWTILRGIKRIRPLYYMTYNKEEVKQFLSSEFGWEWYGGHHLENRFTAFYHSYFLPQRFGIDTRALGFAALARSGQMSREEGLTLLATPPVCDPEILGLVKKRLRLSEAEFAAVMQAPHHHWTEFKTYKKTFERMRPLFYLLMKAGKVNESFYMKFCFP
ncbi:MAG: N-acetyl sugar amidotransferase [Chlamydiia bacterium]|nr:N-acetyl sugar amidotransferase [Chlamydiia bacterium]